MSLKESFIPNEDDVFCRVASSFCSSKDKRPKATAFTNTPKDGNNLSCDWNKYCTPETSRALIGKQINQRTKEYKDPSKFFIYQFNVGDVRTIRIPDRNQEIEHDPLVNDPELEGTPNNIAHSIMIGNKGDDDDPELRLKLVEIGKWAIGPDS